jgi:acetyl-CoA carboxylase biotin carboxyl carrier protein
MDFSQIKELAQLMNELSLTGIEVKEGENSIRLEKQGVPVSVPVAAAAPEASGMPEGAPVGLTAVTAPMVGVFYASPSPDAAPYVSVGDKVKSGDVLCIVEAMKLMNEITAEVDGTVAQVCVENGAVVEYGQAMFYIKRD